MFEIYEFEGETFEVSPDQLSAFMEKYPNAMKKEKPIGVELYQGDKGETFEVSLDQLDMFKEKYPNATKVDEPGKTTDPASNDTDSGSESGSLELPKVTYKDVDLPEGKFIESVKKKLGGLGFTFEETGFRGVDFIPSDYVNITSPPDADGNTVTKRFSVDQWLGKRQSEADDINAFVKEHAGKSQDVDTKAYASAWNQVNKRAKEQDLDKLSSQELVDFSNNILLDLDKSKDVTSITKRIEQDMGNFTQSSISSLRKKHDVNTVEGREAALEELNTLLNKEFSNRVVNDPEYKKLKESSLKAVKSYFGQDIEKQVRKEGELEVMPGWVNKNPVLNSLVKGAWGTANVKLPKAKYDFTGLNEAKKLEDVGGQIEEYENMDPNATVRYDKGFSTDPNLSIPTKEYKVSELTELLKRNKKVYEEKVAYNIIKSDAYQQKLSKITLPEIFSEDGVGVSGEEFGRIIGDQGVQMITAAFTLGGSTLIQEGGGAYSEITTAKAAMKMFPEMDKEKATASFQRLPMEKKTAAIIDLIEKGEGDLGTAFTIGATNAGLDLVSNFIVVGKAAKFLPKSLGRDFLALRYKEFLKGGWKTMGKDVAIGSFSEFVTETMQEGVNIFGVGKATGEGLSDMATKENLTRLMEAGGQALIATGPIVGGGQIVSTTTKEIVNKVASIKNPEHQRNYINQSKKQIDKEFKDGKWTRQERDDIFTSLESAEQSFNFKNLDGKGKEQVINKFTDISKNDTKINELEQKIKKQKKESLDVIGEETSNVIDEIELKKLKKENAKSNKDIIAEVFTSNYRNSGKGLANWVNEQKDGLFKDKEIITFKTVKEAEKYINSKNLKFNTEQQKQDFLDGKINGANLGNLAVLVDENINKNTKKGDWTSANAIHHEVLHFILDGMDTKELETIMNSTISKMKASKDPKMIDMYDLTMQRFNQYKEDPSVDKATEIEEFFTSLSDAAQALKLNDLNVENGSVINDIGEAFQKLFTKNTTGSIDYSNLNAENTLEFIKKYNDFNGKGPKYQPIQVKGGTDVRERAVESKIAPETLIKTIKRGRNPKQVKTAEDALVPQYQALALEALGYTEAKGDILRENVVSAVNEYYEAIVRNYDPKKGAFSTHVYNNIAPKNDTIFEKAKTLAKRDETVSLSAPEVKELADATETTDKGPDTRRKKTNILKIGKVDKKADTIKKIVKVKKGDTFKEVSDNNTGKVAEEIFDVPANKITDPKKNLTYAKKIKDGIPEPSEAGNIQSFYGGKQAVEQLVKILPPENVTSSDADINEIGENIDVDREVLGRGLGLTNRMLNYFYNKTNRRSKGLTSQPFIWELKSEFKNPTSELIDKLQEDLGITPRGELNNYNRNIGQLLKGMAKFQAQQTSLSTAQRILTEQKAPKKQIASITAAQSSKVAFSKSVVDIVGVRSLFQLETKGIDKLLRLYGVDSTFDLKTEEGINNFIEEVKTKLLPLMPKDFWFGKSGGTVFTPSYYVVGSSDNKVLKQKYKDLYNNILVPGIKALAKDSDVKFGKPIKGITDFSVSSYSTIFKDGKTIKGNTKAIKLWNKKVATIHEEMWKRFNKAIAKDKNNAKVIGNYMKMVGSDTKHWHKLGAQFVGYSKKITGKRFEYEHAMPATSAYLYLMDAALSESNFDASYGVVINNYKLIALDKAMDKKLTKVGLQRKMPEGWDLIQNNWWDRYFNDLVNNVDGGIDPSSIVGLDGKTFAEMFNIKKPITKQNVKESKTLNKAVVRGRKTIKESKGITVLDFDDTLATSKSLVISTSPEGVVRKLTAEEFATEGADLLDQGWTHDFSEFSKVVDGKVASLFKKAMKLQGKFGPENMFVLTARPADSAPAIFEFLKANGLNIPLKNITGLANSTSEAKALWIADKVGEGYNDFYFADDALQNVQAVKNMLDQFDVKSKVQQARVKFSKGMNDQFNDILENVTGIQSDKRFSIIKGRKRGESKGKFRVFIPPSHEDFVGLLYNFLGKGKEGNAHRDFFEQALIRPLNRANREYDTARQSIANDYKALNKQFEDVKKKLTKKTSDGDFTFQDAIRVYLWDKHGHKIPGLSETDQTKLSELVTSDPQLQSYAETLNVISKQDDYVNPTEGWNSGDIRMDLDDATGRVGRQQYFSEFIENTGVIFSQENLNKIEAGYGKGVRESLEDMLYRIETGRNRPTGQNEQVNKLMNYLNGSVGTVMFFNMRSALLQQMSIVNYINFADNNIFAAAKAFANQKQYWKDFAFIFNSDMLKQRRGGIQTDINGAELAASLRNSKDITRKLISKLLELGFLPTQIGDNIAIATGGAAYYRNRINKYIKQGMSQKEAEAAAFTDFQDITQSTQQSARPDMVSKQQASVIGKVILNFQNVTSQFNRLGKKAFQDIYNRRITKPNTTQMQSDISNAARITYYFAIQNAIFYTLQTALFAMMFDDDEEDVNNLFIKKQERLINGSIDSVLRGTGLIGGVVATLKNVAIAFARQRDVKYNPDESAVGLEALNLSPVLGIKLRKIVNAEKTLNYNKKVIKEMETFDIDNPQWSAVTNYTEAFTNIPLNRLYNKTQNVRQSLNNDHAAWERTLMFLGWSQYNLNLENKKMDDIKEKTKSNKKKKSKRGKIRTGIIR